MNNIQRICSMISGYAGLNARDAQDDGYFELESLYDKIKYIISFSEHVDGVNIVNELEAKIINEFLEFDYDWNSEDDRYWKFQELR